MTYMQIQRKKIILKANEINVIVWKLIVLLPTVYKEQHIDTTEQDSHLESVPCYKNTLIMIERSAFG